MADVRALLRQQRSVRRVNHPHAAYTDSGKLFCRVCDEALRGESSWDDHIQGVGHRRNTRLPQLPNTKSGERYNEKSQGMDLAASGQKRRRSETNERGLAANDDTGAEILRTKRGKFDAAESIAETKVKESSKDLDDEDTSHGSHASRHPSIPALSRRTSGTPTQGVELEIPSRPATPVALKEGFMGGSERSGSSGGHASAVSTPRIASIGRSPLIPQDASTATLSSNAPVAQPQRNGTNAEALGTFVSSSSASEPIDEAEWAAFEAEVVNAPSSSNTKVSSDGVIASAAPRTADEAALDGIEQRRGDASGTKLDDEKEEANRALEEEFEDMKELETRVKNLKARREALRYNPSSNAPFPTPTSRDLGGRGGNEARDKVDENENDGGGDDDDDDDEDEENTNDWGAFRFTI